jgi:hypothetical protein
MKFTLLAGRDIHMGAPAYAFAVGLLATILVACTGASGPSTLSRSVEKAAPTRSGVVTPTAMVLPTDLNYARPMVQLLNQSGVTVQSVHHAKEESMFQSTHQAASIETDLGVVDIVFFAVASETKGIQVSSLAAQEAGRYVYRISAPHPTLSHDVTMDADRPVYFLAQAGMFTITENAQLHTALKRILAAGNR